MAVCHNGARETVYKNNGQYSSRNRFGGYKRIRSDNCPSPSDNVRTRNRQICELTQGASSPNLVILNKVTLERCASCPVITDETKAGDMSEPLPFATPESPPDTTHESPDDQELDSSQELERPDPPNQSYTEGYSYSSNPPPQNGKRCGVIFVETAEVPRENAILSRYSSREDINQSSASQSQSWREGCPILKIYSFVVVRGRASGIWSLPKGRMDSETESEEECALRELYQETGIRLPTISGLPRIVIGRNVYFVYHTTRALFNEFTIHDSYEVGEVAWKTMAELRRITCNKDLRAVLRYPHNVYPYHQHIFGPCRPSRPQKSYQFSRGPSYSPIGFTKRSSQTCSKMAGENEAPVYRLIDSL